MMQSNANTSPIRQARITGAVWLLYVVVAIAGALFLKGLVVPTDAVATATNILAHESAFRAGATIGLLSTTVYIALTACLYELLRPVNRNIALLAAFFGLAGCTVQAVGTVFQGAGLMLLKGAFPVTGFTVEQVRTIALVLFRMPVPTGYVYLILFALFDILIGYLIYRSTFLPRILGMLMMIAGVAWLTFALPPFANPLLPYVIVVGGLAEVAILLWLLIKGVDADRWLEQARSAPITDQRSA